MATIKCKGLTGVQFDLTVTMGSTTMNGLTALAQAVEGQEIITAMYAEIHASKDPSINQTNKSQCTVTYALSLQVEPNATNASYTPNGKKEKSMHMT